MERERDDERAVGPRVRDDVVADDLLLLSGPREERRIERRGGFQRRSVEENKTK